MRLIDADELLNELNDKYTSIADINAIIIEQPTAYNLDKVVEQLCEHCEDRYECYDDCDFLTIVKAGGKE